MDETIRQELQKLIEEGRVFYKNINFQFGGYFFNNDSTSTLFKQWEKKSLRFIKRYYKSDYGDLEKVFNSKIFDTKNILDESLGILKAIDEDPEPLYTLKNEEKSTSGNVINIHNNQTQSQEQKQEQSQTQKILQEVFLEAIKDELTGKQQKEIKAILEEHQDNIEKAKPKLVEKLADFGTNVLANVVSNIITNPIMTGLF